MRLPLLIATSPAQVPAGFRTILNMAAPPSGSIGLDNCVCCSGQSALRDALNAIYIDWAHNQDTILGAAIVPAAEADLDDLHDFLTSDVMLAARYRLLPRPR